MAMEKDQNSNNSPAPKAQAYRPRRYTPDSLLASSNDASPSMPRTPQLNLAIPKSSEELSAPSNNLEQSEKEDDEEQQYWEGEEDDGYWGEMDEDDNNDEDLEETYRRGF